MLGAWMRKKSTAPGIPSSLRGWPALALPPKRLLASPASLLLPSIDGATATRIFLPPWTTAAILPTRELEGIGRLAGMTGKLIIELGEFGHFELLGARSDVVYERACRHLLTVLPVRREEAWTLKELGSRFEGSESTLKRALDDLCRTGEITGQQRVGHAAQAKSKKAIGYWRPLERQQEELVCDAG